MLDEEMQSRNCTGPFLICSIGTEGRSLVVNEARLDLDEHGKARYVPRHPENVKTFTLYADDDSFFHEKPNPGDAFDITLKNGHVIESALRLESGKYTREDGAKHGESANLWSVYLCLLVSLSVSVCTFTHI